jgi:hypothetical protein
VSQSEASATPAKKYQIAIYDSVPETIGEFISGQIQGAYIRVKITALFGLPADYLRCSIKC